MGATNGSTDESIFRGYAGRLLLVLAVGSLTLFLGRLALPPLLPLIVEQLSITQFQAGIGLTLMWGLMALLQYPSGRISDQRSRKLSISAGLGLGVVGFAVLSASTTYAHFLLALSLVGAGAGFYTAAVYGQLADLFVARRGQAFGINSASSDLGGVLTIGVSATVLAVGRWRTAFVPIVLVLLAVMLAFRRWSDESSGADQAGIDLRGTVGRLYATDGVRGSLLAFSLFMFVWQGTTSFLPVYLQSTKGFSSALASQAFAGLFFVGMVTKPLAGRLGDQYEHTTVALGANLLTAGGLILTVVSRSRPVTAAGIAIMALGLGAFLPVMNTDIMNQFPDGSMGGDFGASRTIFLGLGSLGSTYVGFVADRFDFTVAFLGLVGCLFVNAAITIRLSRERSA